MIGGVALGLAVVCLVLGGLVLVGYPLVVVLLARRRGRPARAQVWTPKVSLLLVCRNESKNLPRKIASLLALDYPKDKLEILVADDASTDGTVRILNAARAELPKLQIVRSSSHRGKPANLNALMARASGEVVVFNDARQPLDPQAIRALCAALADPEVGGATGIWCCRSGTTVRSPRWEPTGATRARSDARKGRSTPLSAGRARSTP